MKITIKDDPSFRLEETISLYRDAGWNAYVDNPGMLEKAYRSSLKVVAAYDEDKLVGIIRAVGDGASILYIQDLIVMGAYQRNGIGRRLLEEMLRCYPDVYQTVLLTDEQEKTVAFYQAVGLVKSSRFGCTAFLRFSKAD